MNERSEFQEPLIDSTAKGKVINIELFPTGDDASGYRTRNNRDRCQRRLVTNREGVLFSKCTMSEVIHGKLGKMEGRPGHEDDPATLIILNFEFGSGTNTRRVRAARIKLHFADEGDRDEDERDDPTVVKIHPNGDLRLAGTSQIIETKISGGINLGTPPIVGLQAGGQFTWEENKVQDKHDAIRLNGHTGLMGRDYGDENAAFWNLMENRTDKTGVPAEMCVSVLLMRQCDRPFQCNFAMELELDSWSSIQSAFMRVMGDENVDDPVFFDPSRRPTEEQIKKYPVESLGSTNLRAFSYVVTKRILEETVHYE